MRMVAMHLQLVPIEKSCRVVSEWLDHLPGLTLLECIVDFTCRWTPTHPSLESNGCSISLDSIGACRQNVCLHSRSLEQGTRLRNTMQTARFARTRPTQHELAVLAGYRPAICFQCQRPWSLSRCHERIGPKSTIVELQALTCNLAATC